MGCEYTLKADVRGWYGRWTFPWPESPSQLGNGAPHHFVVNSVIPESYFSKLLKFAESTEICRHVVSALSTLDPQFSSLIVIGRAQSICRYFGEPIDTNDTDIVKRYCNSMCDVCTVLSPSLSLASYRIHPHHQGVQISWQNQAPKDTVIVHGIRRYTSWYYYFESRRWRRRIWKSSCPCPCSKSYVKPIQQRQGQRKRKQRVEEEPSSWRIIEYNSQLIWQTSKFHIIQWRTRQ